MVNLNQSVDIMAPPLVLMLCLTCVGIYVKSLKFCVVSRCSKIKFCGCECDREVLDGDNAVELATHNSNNNFPMINNAVPPV